MPWATPVSLSTTRSSKLVYDFGGFDPMYRRMRYDTPTAGDLADQVAKLMPDTQSVDVHDNRGLHHGAWVP